MSYVLFSLCVSFFGSLVLSLVDVPQQSLPHLSSLSYLYLWTKKRLIWKYVSGLRPWYNLQSVWVCLLIHLCKVPSPLLNINSCLTNIQKFLLLFVFQPLSLSVGLSSEVPSRGDILVVYIVDECVFLMEVFFVF